MQNQTATELTYSEQKKRQQALHHDNMCALKYTEHTAKLFNEYIQEMLGKGFNIEVLKRVNIDSLNVLIPVFRSNFSFFTHCEYLFQRNLYRSLKNYKTDEI